MQSATAAQEQRNEREVTFFAKGIKCRRKRYGACDDMASQRGLEPPTYRLGGGRSIQLSYWDRRAA